MSIGVLVAGASLVGVAATSIVLLRRHEKSARVAQARRYGWTVDDRVGDDLRARLRGLTLFEVGHSRRVDGAYRKDGPQYLLQYLCETGFEHRRQTHRWSVVVAEARHSADTAVLTTEDWLAVTAELPGRSIICREPTRQGDPVRLIIVEDEEAWRKRLKGPFGRWLDAQPLDRTWEILPDYVVGYEPGAPRDTAFVELAEAAGKAAGMLTTSEQADPVPSLSS